MGIPLPYDTRQTDTIEPTALLEALLFLSGDPMTVTAICAHTGWTQAETEATANRLQHLLSSQRGGIVLIRRLSAGHAAGPPRCPAMGPDGDDGVVLYGTGSIGHRRLQTAHYAG